jgi:hypothetical protein
MSLPGFLLRRFSAFSPRPLKTIADATSTGSLLRRASEYQALRVSPRIPAVSRPKSACNMQLAAYHAVETTRNMQSALTGFSDIHRRRDDSAQSPF